ncbi:MAG TPA: hypothetical protein VMT43_08685 [Acidimicrobiales bacterium]|nr:hypothetical protein [Acidimicrobiales bacterium]
MAVAPEAPAAWRRPERIYAAYLAAQAIVGLLLWIAYATSGRVRGWFELLPSHRPVTDSFALADVLVAVVASALSAWAVDRSRSWAVPAVAFTAGAMVYPTFYLIAWVSLSGTGRAALTIMLAPATLTCWIAYQTWCSRLRT